MSWNPAEMAADRRFCVYCSPAEINDATFRYIEVIRRGLIDSGLEDTGITQDKTKLRQCTVVVTISCLPAIRALLLHPSARLVHWFQGIEAVERRFLHRGWRGLGRYLLWSAMEAIVLRRAQVKLFVSNEMRTFLGDSDQPKSNSLVIPCYNVDFDPRAWSSKDRYRKLELVYAGSLYPWQCVEDSLKVFAVVHQRRPDARFTLFTREVERARQMCIALGVPDVRIASLTPEQLLPALRNFSYGFILREEMAINQVSTPTKFSSYLGAGVIPILTKATPALVRMAEQSPYVIVAAAPKNHERIADAILALADASPAEEKVRQSFAEVFDQHFNDAKHAQRITRVATELLC